MNRPVLAGSAGRRVRVVGKQAIVAATAVAVATAGAEAAHARAATAEAPPELAAAATVAETFVETAVRRVDLSRSFTLVTNSLRQGQTRTQWARGNIAVIPVPQARIEQARLIVYQPARQPLDIAWLTVISGRQGGVTSHWSFRIDLRNQHGSWRVDYWAPAPEVAWLTPAVTPTRAIAPRTTHRPRDPGSCCLTALLATDP